MTAVSIVSCMCQVLLCPFAIPLMFILSVSKDGGINQRALLLKTGICTFRDVVKLTAQFVARNGRQFLTTVMQREQRNYLFDFLRPQHSLFNYFTKLVEQYTKVSEDQGVVLSVSFGVASRFALTSNFHDFTG